MCVQSMERLVIWHLREISDRPKTSAANSKLWSARPEKGERAAKEAFPLFGISPFRAVLCTQAVEARKKSRIAGSLNFKTHMWVDAADATGTLGGALSIFDA